MCQNSETWHKRFQVQASWTASIRSYLYSKAELNTSHRILEVGSGTGVILKDFQDIPQVQVFGLDISYDFIKISKVNRFVHVICGDVNKMPYPRATFDITICHYFLLWVDAQEALNAMIEVTRPGGYVIALAEPDYRDRIDYPPELELFGDLQTSSLIKSGANPIMGRLLPSLFHSSGLCEITTGIIGAEWSAPPELIQVTSEQETMIEDLTSQIDRNQLAHYSQVDRVAWKSGSRVLYIPTFFALGRVPENPT